MNDLLPRIKIEHERIIGMNKKFYLEQKFNHERIIGMNKFLPWTKIQPWTDAWHEQIIDQTGYLPQNNKSKT
jgi:hypothetical protein